jgi:hypothetical protein
MAARECGRSADRYGDLPDRAGRQPEASIVRSDVIAGCGPGDPIWSDNRGRGFTRSAACRPRLRASEPMPRASDEQHLSQRPGRRLAPPGEPKWAHHVSPLNLRVVSRVAGKRPGPLTEAVVCCGRGTEQAWRWLARSLRLTRAASAFRGRTHCYYRPDPSVCRLGSARLLLS